tara:strand:- start:4388 stop:5743 length:1356 start_codon:yes stop_codon:yes gene_type:complete
MKKVIKSLSHNTSIYEKLSLILLSLIPFALAGSILIAELFSAFIGIFALVWIIKNKQNTEIFQNIKIPLYTIILFYLLILVSLSFSYNFNKSFLPSFFYFRYLLLSLGIFILIYKFEQTLKIIFISLIFLLILIVIDSAYEMMKIYKLFGLTLEEYRFNQGSTYFITSFFGDEKKLGSFLVRLLPLILSLAIFFNFKIFKQLDIKIPILVIVGVLVFLTSERVAFFLFILTCIALLKVFKRRLLFLLFSFLILISLITAQPKLFEKYVYVTLSQFEILNSHFMYKDSEKENRVKIVKNLDFSKFKYISDEHEKLLKSGIIIFKENIFTGSGLKNYHRYCKNIKDERSLDIKCSSHPHNTYIQILSDIGIFGGLLIISIFFYILYLNLKILFIKNPSTIIKSFYVLNIGIIINLMPFIPSGSFFNNWINLMLYFPLGTWLYLFYYIKKNKKI